MSPLTGEAWDISKRHIAEALWRSGSTHSLDDVRVAIEAGRAILLSGEHSALVLETVIYPACSVLRIWLGGGDLQELKGWVPEVSKIARSLGCARIRIEGRHGWVKALKPIGVDRSWTVIEKDV